MAKKRRTSIADKVKEGLDKPRGAEFGYLRLPEGVKTFKVEPGSTVKGDISPYAVTSKNHMDKKRFGVESGDIWYRKPFLVHRNIGESRDTYVCPQTEGLPCPIHNYRQERMQANASKDETDVLKASLRHLYVWIPKGEEDYEEKPHVLDISNHCFGRALEDEAKEQDVPNFADLEGGTTLKCRFSTESLSFSGGGKTKPIEFAKIARIDFEDRDYDYPDDHPDTVPNLDEVLVILPYKKLEAIFFEEEMQDEESVTETKDETPQEDVKSEPEQPEPELKKPTRTKRGSVTKPKEPVKEKPKEEKPEPKKQANSGECDFGHEFGVEFEKHPECETECEKWDKCLEANQG